MAQYMVTANIPIENRNTVTKRFAAGDAIQLPDGATLVGRWHAPGELLAWSVVETDDPKVVYDWVMKWNDVINTRVIPVLSDAEAGELIVKHGLD